MANQLILESPARIHFGLVDLGGVTHRSFGGSGAFLSDFVTRMRFEDSSCGLSLGESTEPYLRPAIEDVLGRFLAQHPTATGRVDVVDSPMPHAGFGSKTSAVLGALVLAALGNRIDLSISQLQEMSGRGGASGVGIHGFFQGGFIADAGHYARPPQGPWLPSGACLGGDVPVLVCAHPMPDVWRAHVLLPAGTYFSGSDEVEFFSKETPLSFAEVQNALAATWHALVPAVITSNLDLFASGLRDLSVSGLKAHELNAQPASRTIVDSIYEQFRLPVGMSSMGPLVFVICRATDEIELDLRYLCDRLNAKYVRCTRFINHGYSVRCL